MAFVSSLCTSRLRLPVLHSWASSTPRTYVPFVSPSRPHLLSPTGQHLGLAGLAHPPRQIQWSSTLSTLRHSPHGRLLPKNLPAHRTFPLTRLLLQPMRDTMHMKAMSALPHHLSINPRQPSHATPRERPRDRGHILIGHSSPGNRHRAHVPSNCTVQMPQVSSAVAAGRSHFHSATEW